ncbi:MAG: methionine gamma-lyase family protein [Bacilli bacterium]|nr:methionine gamma-lyase family protein [Bacilli bacterium]
MLEELGISNETIELIEKAEKELKPIYEEIDKNCNYNSLKVLSAFQKYQVQEGFFNSTTGYGYNDLGRDNIEKIFAEVLDGEDAIVRSQFISGTHALTVALFAFLRPNDLMLSISGLPYDTLHEVIGIKENKSSLISYGIKYDQIDLVDNDFNYEAIKEYLKKNKVKLIEIQRSKGYSTRKSITLDKVEKAIKTIREVDKDVIIMVDNCYCEFVELNTPLTVGADVMVGSLIKNLGGGIAPNGAYIAGRKDLVDLAGERLTCPGEGREVGPTLGINKQLLQGLFFAPHVVSSSLKTAVLTAKVLEDLGYRVEPKYDEHRADIVQNIIFNDEEKLIKYVQGIQAGSPIDSNSIPMPWDMPGYEDKVIMASGSFTQGSSIELSCDAPIRPPYIAYQQGGLTYEYGRLGVARAIEEMKK